MSTSGKWKLKTYFVFFFHLLSCRSISTLGCLQKYIFQGMIVNPMPAGMEANEYMFARWDTAPVRKPFAWEEFLLLSVLPGYLKEFSRKRSGVNNLPGRNLQQLISAQQASPSPHLGVNSFCLCGNLLFPHSGSHEAFNTPYLFNIPTFGGSTVYIFFLCCKNAFSKVMVLSQWTWKGSISPVIHIGTQ